MFIGLLVASVAVISVCVVFIYSEVSFAELSSYMASSPFRQERHVAFGSLLPCRTTVISAYFLFKSKHSPAEYDKWMRTFMASVSGAPLVMFIDTSSYEKYKHLRKSMRTTFVVYGSVWQIMGELEAERNRTYAESYLVSQRHIDPERKIHTSELYAIWNLKAFMVNKVLDKNPYKSEFFIYSDAGAWRSEQPIENWPSEQFVDEVAARIEDRMLFGKVNRKDPIAPGKKVSIEGTFFAGSTKAMRDYKRAYYDMHDKMLDARLFIGKWFQDFRF